MIDSWDIIKSELSLEEKDEDYYFAGWHDESCGNYVGYLLKTQDFNIIVSRMAAGKSGLYSLTKVDPGVTSGGDPFGEHPERYANRIENLSLAQVAETVRNLLK